MTTTSLLLLTVGVIIGAGIRYLAGIATAHDKKFEHLHREASDALPKGADVRPR